MARLRSDYPADPERWSLAQLLYFAVNHLRDPSGAFGVYRPTVTVPGAVRINTNSLADACDQLAAISGISLPEGSSAAGEQPKFLLREADDRRWIVKFSPPRGTPFGERWNALLHLEKLALDVLQDHGVVCTYTQIVETVTRTYLFARRFDRSAKFGYRHLVAAAAVHDHFVRAPHQHWVGTCRALQGQALLSPVGADTAAKAFLFGQFIGNTDMHFGNLSFIVEDVTRPRFEVAPIYDMLPMMWRPNIHSGNLDADTLRQSAA